MITELRKGIGNELLFLAIRILPRSEAWARLVIAVREYWSEGISV